jgi:hydroxymethylpyrimidine pyrophosphatase-like HAD family hydrolase
LKDRWIYEYEYKQPPHSKYAVDFRKLKEMSLRGDIWNPENITNEDKYYQLYPEKGESPDYKCHYGVHIVSIRHKYFTDVKKEIADWQTDQNNLLYSSKKFEDEIQSSPDISVENKAIALKEVIESLGLNSSDCAVMGDDWPDLAMMKNAGLRVCPAQAHEAVKEFVHYVTTQIGGSSAVRETCDLILKAQNRYEELLNKARQ